MPVWVAGPVIVHLPDVQPAFSGSLQNLRTPKGGAGNARHRGKEPRRFADYLELALVAVVFDVVDELLLSPDLPRKSASLPLRKLRGRRIMFKDLRFTPNVPAVVYEEFADEVIIIHLNKGSYYNLENSAATIWRACLRGASLTEIATSLQAQHPAVEQLAEVVKDFIAELQQEELLRPSSELPPEISPELPLCPVWSPPVLQKHTDMQDLLLLDPIHEVDEKGWPHAASSNT